MLFYKLEKEACMGRITIDNYTKEHLTILGFKYNRYLSDLGDEVYTYKFPVSTYNSHPTLECEIAVSTINGVVNINVFNAQTRELYPSYYNREYGYNKILANIDTKTSKELERLNFL